MLEDKSRKHNCFLYIPWALSQHSFLASRFLVYCCVVITLVSFPHLLNILYLMLLFILTEYGGCSNSQLIASEYVFNCLQNNQWDGCRKPMIGSLPLLFFYLFFSFCLGCITFSSYWTLRKETWLHFIYECLLSPYLSLERKGQMCVCVCLKEPWINLHNFEQSCLPDVMSFWHIVMHTKCLST